jgi:polyphosphate glucokinase
MTTLAIGIDIGGTGIKGAVVDVTTGELVSERVKVATPQGGEPDDIVAAVVEMIDGFGPTADGLPVGVCFPAIVLEGRTMSAANVSKKWIGLEAEKLFEASLKRDIHFVNDADAAGVAEARYGAAKGKQGLVILTTLGTGIGTAFLYNGTLIPNTELGHMELGGKDAETRMSYAAKERKGLSWAQWAARLQTFYATLVMLYSPTLFIVGGGVSKSDHEFLPLLKLDTPIVPATHRNNAGILGAAALAAEHSTQRA